jgi:hypothetical protein
MEFHPGLKFIFVCEKCQVLWYLGNEAGDHGTTHGHPILVIGYTDLNSTVVEPRVKHEEPT